MPLCAVTSTSVVHQCSRCGVEQEIKHADLKVELSDEGPIAAEIVIACAMCHAESHILGAAKDVPEHSEPGSYGHLHRLLADQACAAVLDTRPALVEGFRSAPRVRRRKDDELAKWFPSGLAIRDDRFASQRTTPT